MSRRLTLRRRTHGAIAEIAADKSQAREARAAPGPLALALWATCRGRGGGMPSSRPCVCTSAAVRTAPSPAHCEHFGLGALGRSGDFGRWARAASDIGSLGFGAVDGARLSAPLGALRASRTARIAGLALRWRFAWQPGLRVGSALHRALREASARATHVGYRQPYPRTKDAG